MPEVTSGPLFSARTDPQFVRSERQDPPVATTPSAAARPLRAPQPQAPAHTPAVDPAVAAENERKRRALFGN